ncbi:cache domain-containing sensor histidine kinase [Cohnella hashimotonis]|uniref:histidine kinase n=1 Tax=Cohnella hashimotonis TaxID=2826895 RepID=A0ABT6TDD8_9BACL|nr:sensor histidine kinase [Cohnella hashimotonis]MDI4644333.1 sensor histidine kinase [Cohnella hashimotonis]
MFRFKIANRIATRLIVLLLAVILLPTIFIGVFFYRTSSTIVKENVRQSSIQVAQQAADSLSNILNVGSDTSDLIYSQVAIQEKVLQEKPKTPDSVKVDNKIYINNFLNTIIYSSSFVKIIYILEPTGTSWGSGIFNQAKVDRYNIRSFDWIREAERLNGKLAWTTLQKDKFSGAGDNTALVIPAARVLKDFKTMRNIGYIVINIDGEAVLDKISQIRLGKTGHFFVTDQQGRVMIDRNREAIGYPVEIDALGEAIAQPDREFEYAQAGTPFYGVKQPLSNGWWIVGVVPLKEVTGQLESLQRSVFIWSGGFGLLAMVIGLFFARRITKPIGRLTAQMKRVGEGDLSARTAIRSGDEIGQMSNQFNRMLGRLDRLMSQVREEQQKKQRAEMRAVMHRIHPHFMFNTLSTIKWLIKLGDNDRAYEGLSAFTRLLEANMGKKGHMVTLEEEIEIITKFLAILELRYSLPFKLDVRLGTGVAGFSIPRMLIQPLVENAVFHGFVSDNRGGTIWIEAEDTGACIAIRITDDGRGMTPEQLAQVTTAGSPDHAGTEAGIGFRHVRECIELYFSPGSKMNIQSVEGQGTVIAVTLNKPQRQEQEHQAEGEAADA